MLDKPFLTTVVGSMPRPKFFRERVDRHLVEGTGEGDLLDLMDRSIPYVAALQEAAGVDVISDGEWRRKSYVGVIAEMLTGVEQFKVPLDSFRHDARVGYAVIGPVAPTREGLFAEEATKLRRHTSKAVRVALPTPHLTASFLWDPVKSPEHYSEREFIEVMVPIIRREVELLRDAGVRYVQFDDTRIGGVHAEEPESQAYRDALFDSVDTLNRVVDGIDGIYTSLHLCGKRHIGPDQVPRYDTMLPGFERLHIDMPMFEMLQFDDYDRELAARPARAHGRGLRLRGVEDLRGGHPGGDRRPRAGDREDRRPGAHGAASRLRVLARHLLRHPARRDLPEARQHDARGRDAARGDVARPASRHATTDRCEATEERYSWATCTAAARSSTPCWPRSNTPRPGPAAPDRGRLHARARPARRLAADPRQRRGDGDGQPR